MVRALVFVLPFGASVVFVWAVSRAVAAPDGTAGFVGWWIALSAAGSLVMWLVDRAARRLLPLAALLQLSLVFPDQAPSRFRSAMEAGRVAHLEERLTLARQAATASTPAESARLLLTLVAALSQHDKLTRGHSERVRGYAVMIGRELRLTDAELDQLNWAALLHDIGKLEVSVDILNKPGRPSEEEWQQLKRHPLYGEALIEPMRPWLGEWADAVGYHHERWDGKGYPRGVAGEEIPLPGRIVAIADVFDVITSARSYKEAGSPTAGREEIARCAGDQFDPRLVRAFLGVSLGRMRMVMGPLSWLAHMPILGRLPLGSMASTVWGAAGVVVATTASGLAGTAVPHHDVDAHAARAPVVREQPAAEPRAEKAVPVRRNRATRDTAPEREPARDALPPLTPTPVSAPAAPEPATPTPTAPSTPTPEEPTPERPTPTPTPTTPAPSSTTAPPTTLPTLAPAPTTDPAPEPVAPPASLAPVAPVPNHPPTFTAGADRTVAEDSGPSATAGWATAIDPGPFERDQVITFGVDADDPSLFSVQPRVSPAGTLAFTPAPDAHGTATVTVRAHDDGGTTSGGADTSAPKTFTIIITSVNDAPRFAAGAAQVLLEDDGAQAIPGWAGDIVPGAADESAQAVTFDVDDDNPALFSAPPEVSPAGTLTYTPAPDAHGTATVTVRAHDDGGTADGGVDAGVPQTFSITIASVNDAPRFTAGPDQTVQEDAGATTVSAWATGIAPGPADEAAQALTFTTTNDNPSLFTTQPALAPDGALSFAPRSGSHGTATVTVHATDDGGTANGGVDATASETFTITVLAPNHAPAFTRGADPTVPEDNGPTTIPGWATGISPGPSYESGQAVSFLLDNPPAALLAAPPAVSPNGTLTFTPAPNANGAATFTVRAHDDGGTIDGGVDTSAPQTFTVSVNAVNDAPSFAAGASKAVLLNAALQTVPGWATNISPGPADESGQAVSFVVTNDNPGLFAVQPRVDPDGTLVFRPGFSLIASATVTVRAVDDGGTADGGVDTSPPQTFTITTVIV